MSFKSPLVILVIWITPFFGPLAYPVAAQKTTETQIEFFRKRARRAMDDQDWKEIVDAVSQQIEKLLDLERPYELEKPRSETLSTALKFRAMAEIMRGKIDNAKADIIRATKHHATGFAYFDLLELVPNVESSREFPGLPYQLALVGLKTTVRTDGEWSNDFGIASNVWHSILVDLHIEDHVDTRAKLRHTEAVFQDVKIPIMRHQALLLLAEHQILENPLAADSVLLDLDSYDDLFTSKTWSGWLPRKHCEWGKAYLKKLACWLIAKEELGSTGGIEKAKASVSRGLIDSRLPAFGFRFDEWERPWSGKLRRIEARLALAHSFDNDVDQDERISHLERADQEIKKVLSATVCYPEALRADLFYESAVLNQRLGVLKEEDSDGTHNQTALSQFKLAIDSIHNLRVSLRNNDKFPEYFPEWFPEETSELSGILDPALSKLQRRFLTGFCSALLELEPKDQQSHLQDVFQLQASRLGKPDRDPAGSSLYKKQIKVDFLQIPAQVFDEAAIGQDRIVAIVETFPGEQVELVDLGIEKELLATLSDWQSGNPGKGYNSVWKKLLSSGEGKLVESIEMRGYSTLAEFPWASLPLPTQQLRGKVINLKISDFPFRITTNALETLTPFSRR